MRLISCARCGRIHEWGKCPVKKEAKHYNSENRTEARKFRSTAQWQRKAAEIRRRDAGLCKLCLYEGRINNRRLSVHHITPISENADLKLDNDNLITLCNEHHELVEGNNDYTELLHRLAITPPEKVLPEPGTGSVRLAEYLKDREPDNVPLIY